MSKRQRINNLGSINGILQQMRAVYRAARFNCPDEVMDTNSAKVLSQILKDIANVHRDNEIEARLRSLEDKLNDKS